MSLLDFEYFEGHILKRKEKKETSAAKPTFPALQPLEPVLMKIARKVPAKGCCGNFTEIAGNSHNRKSSGQWVKIYNN